MRTILYILQKEFIQIFRNKMMLPIIFIVPIIQLIVLVYAATLEMQDIDTYIVDKDQTTTSRELINKFRGSPFFKIQESSFSMKDANDALEENRADIIINIPSGFERKLFKENQSELQLLINAINGTAAGLTNVYATFVILDFNKNIIAENINIIPLVQTKQINVSSSFWYNPELNYKIYMLPGILVILVTIIGMFLTALNLVREKEMETIEQINVTPIKKYQFIIGKLLPFLIIALFELAFGLAIGKILFDIPMVGNMFLLFGFATIYLFAVLGLGLFISTASSSQQQVMFIAFFFMITFIMMSGIFTPIESMPEWAQTVNIINPFAYFMKVNRMILLKGSDFFDLKTEFISMTVYAIAALSLAVWKYRKVA